MVIKTFRLQRSLFAFAILLLAAGNQGLATEPAAIPSFHRVLLVNETSQPALVRTESGVLNAALEMYQANGKWRPIAQLRVPIASANPELSAGEVWQFIVSESGSDPSAKVRLAVKVADGMIYSRPFEANMKHLARNQTIDCWLVRSWIQPAPAKKSSMIAVVDPALGD